MKRLRSKTGAFYSWRPMVRNVVRESLVPFSENT